MKVILYREDGTTGEELIPKVEEVLLRNKFARKRDHPLCNENLFSEFDGHPALGLPSGHLKSRLRAYRGQSGGASIESASRTTRGKQGKLISLIVLEAHPELFQNFFESRERLAQRREDTRKRVLSEVGFIYLRAGYNDITEEVFPTPHTETEARDQYASSIAPEYRNPLLVKLFPDCKFIDGLPVTSTPVV